MGSAEVEAFLSHLATERHVAPSTHKQALAALLFLYRQVLDIELPWMQQIGRPKSPLRIPVVLSRAEVARLLEQIEPTFAVVVALLYGAGLRLMECLRLRVKDVDLITTMIYTHVLSSSAASTRSPLESLPSPSAPEIAPAQRASA
jgi:integrase